MSDSMSEKEQEFEMQIVVTVRGYGLPSLVKPQLLNRVVRECELSLGNQFVSAEEA